MLMQFRFEQFVTSLREQGTSCGAKLEILAEKVPVGWGEPVLIVWMRILPMP